MVTVLQKADENINYEKFAQQPVSVVSCLRKEGGGVLFWHARHADMQCYLPRMTPRSLHTRNTFLQATPKGAANGGHCCTIL